MLGVSKPQFPYLSKGLSGLLCQPKALGQAPKPEPPSSWPSLLQPGPGHVSQHPGSPPCQATGKARLALKGGWSLPATRQRCTVAECQEPSPSPALLDKHLEASCPGSSPGSQVVEVFLQPRFSPSAPRSKYSLVGHKRALWSHCGRTPVSQLLSPGHV